MMESVKDVIASMRRYAEGMDKRYVEADEGDKYLECDVIAMRIREFARRLESAAKDG